MQDSEWLCGSPNNSNTYSRLTSDPQSTARAARARHSEHAELVRRQVPCVNAANGWLRQYQHSDAALATHRPQRSALPAACDVLPGRNSSTTSNRLSVAVLSGEGHSGTPATGLGRARMHRCTHCCDSARPRNSCKPKGQKPKFSCRSFVRQPRQRTVAFHNRQRTVAFHNRQHTVAFHNRPCAPRGPSQVRLPTVAE